jgi:hypothetical protein
MAENMATSLSLSTARFNTKAPRYFWNTPDPAGSPDQTLVTPTRKRQKSLINWPAWGLTATTWFCVGMFWPSH